MLLTVHTPYDHLSRLKTHTPDKNSLSKLLLHISCLTLSHYHTLLSHSELKNAINGRSLTEVGELEQSLVYGEAGSAELIKFLQGE